jgi:hypothetical protein
MSLNDSPESLFVRSLVDESGILNCSSVRDYCGTGGRQLTAHPHDFERRYPLETMRRSARGSRLSPLPARLPVVLA